VRDAVPQFGELAVAGLERYPNAARVLAQFFKRNAGWLELVPVRGLDVSTPKAIAETEPYGQVKDDLSIGTAFTPGPDDAWPQLHP
jgi:hypothetical protein